MRSNNNKFHYNKSNFYIFCCCCCLFHMCGVWGVKVVRECVVHVYIWLDNKAGHQQHTQGKTQFIQILAAFFLQWGWLLRDENVEMVWGGKQRIPWSFGLVVLTPFTPSWRVVTCFFCYETVDFFPRNLKCGGWWCGVWVLVENMK